MSLHLAVTVLDSAARPGSGSKPTTPGTPEKPGSHHSDRERGMGQWQGSMAKKGYRKSQCIGDMSKLATGRAVPFSSGRRSSTSRSGIPPSRVGDATTQWSDFLSVASEQLTRESI